MTPAALPADWPFKAQSSLVSTSRQRFWVTDTGPKDAPALLLLEAPGGATRHIRLDPWHAPDGVRPVGGANVLDPDVVVF